ncbi:Uncharacterised protein [Mycobacterium tuberculosis]|nr:Uncharacterised protein [Mycobacterium tuberculosis]
MDDPGLMKIDPEVHENVSFLITEQRNFQVQT